jgi:thymidylate synthase
MSELMFLKLINRTLNYGSKKEIFGHADRYLLSTFGNVIRFNLEDGFPVMTSRKTPWKSAISEMLWYVEGTNDCATLTRDKNIRVWEDWAAPYHNKKYGTNYTVQEWKELVMQGVIETEVLPLHYGNMTNKKFIRVTDRDTRGSKVYVEGVEDYLDQTKFVIDGMKKTPFRKSFHVDMWQSETVYAQADYCGNESVVLPACWYAHTLNYNDGKLNMSVLGRSWDVWLAGAWNIAQYAALLHMYAHCLKLPVGEIEFYTTDCHLYSNLLDQTKEQLSRQSYPFPKLTIKDRGQQYLQDFVIDDFIVEGYKSHPALKGQITVVGGY